MDRRQSTDKTFSYILLSMTIHDPKCTLLPLVAGFNVSNHYQYTHRGILFQIIFMIFREELSLKLNSWRLGSCVCVCVCDRTGCITYLHTVVAVTVHAKLTTTLCMDSSVSCHFHYFFIFNANLNRQRHHNTINENMHESTWLPGCCACVCVCVCVVTVECGGGSLLPFLLFVAHLISIFVDRQSTDICFM